MSRNGGRGRGPRIALIVDHPQRDLGGLVLTAFELCQRGAVCYLVPLNLQDREVWALAPDFVLLNYARVPNEGFARKLAAAGIPFGYLDTEGGVWPDPSMYLGLLWRDHELLRQLRCACMWGPQMANVVVERELLARAQVAVTGCPRFDFYHPAWRSVMSDSGERAAARILVNTNFSMSNPRFATVEQNIAQAREEGLADATVAAAMEAESEAIEAMIVLVRDLVRDFPDSDIVLRPHPFESPEPYRRGLAGLARVTIDNAQPVQVEICRAAVVIQRSCTTALEAGLAGVPTLSPQWMPAPLLMPAAELVSVPCGSYGELRAELDEIMAGRHEPPARVRRAIASVTNDWFLCADGRAHERVSDVVIQAADGQRSVDRARCERFLYGLDDAGARGPGKVGRAVRHRLGIPPDFSFRQLRLVARQNKPGKSLDVGAVRSLLQRIERVRSGTGARAHAVTAAPAHSHYLRRFLGESVALTCDRESLVPVG